MNPVQLHPGLPTDIGMWVGSAHMIQFAVLVPGPNLRIGLSLSSRCGMRHLAWKRGSEVTNAVAADRLSLAFLPSEPVHI